MCCSLLAAKGINDKTLNFSLRQRQGERESQQGQSFNSRSHASEPAQSNTNAVGAQTVIDVSSESSDSSDHSDNFSDSSSVSGDENAYYLGYGRCFNCGECLKLKKALLKHYIALYSHMIYENYQGYFLSFKFAFI